MRNTVLVTFLISVSLSFRSQTICLGEDISVCTSDQIQIANCNTELTNSVSNSVHMDNPTVVTYVSGTGNTSLPDDRWSSPVDIGFEFNFYNTSYNQCVVGSNGLISFDLTKANAFCAWNFSGVTGLPNTAFNDPKTSAMLCYQDMNPLLGGAIEYQTIGNAPNRIFIVLYREIPTFSCGECSYLSVMLFEGSNIIEYHIGNKPLCTSWNGGRAVQATENTVGTTAHVTPGRNISQWTANQECKRYSPLWPANTSSYNITNEQYKIVTSSGTSLIWANTQGQTFPYNDGVLSNIPIPTSSVGYFLIGSACGSSIGSVSSDTTWLTPVSFTATTSQVSCLGGSDGTATVTMNPVIGNLSYLWNDPAAQITQTATGLSAGNYSCQVSSDQGCTGTVNVSISESPPMIVSTASLVDVSCHSENDGTMTVNTIGGTAPYTYSWDNSPSISNVGQQLSAGQQSVTVTDANGCMTTYYDFISEPPPLQIVFLTDSSQICPGNTLTLEVHGIGGSSPYTYTWYENGSFIGIDSVLSVQPENSPMNYCVVLTEVCGSPSVDSCVYVKFFEPIVPGIITDNSEGCAPATFNFQNTSDPINEILSINYQFSDGYSIETINGEEISHTFTDPNDYSCLMTITSVHGCLYQENFENLVRVFPVPTASFTFVQNPTTMFETTVQTFDQSSGSVVQWDWSSPYSVPTESLEQNPTFQFPEGEVGNYNVALEVTNQFGCIDTTTSTLNVVEDVLFYAPNTFTPDNDEFNQTWGIYSKGIDRYNFSLYLFNRWGEIIWESHDPEANWDGTYAGSIVPQGTYSWKAIVKSTLNDEKKEFVGHLNVLK